MKKKISFIVILFTFLFISCEENFDPYGDFVEKYAFTCILKSDQTMQTATLSRTYRPDGFDPYANTTDPAITGADIRVWYNDTVFVFRDTSTVRTDTSRYNTPLRYYYNNEFFVGNRKPIELEVLLPNGRRLFSSSVTPSEINLDNYSDAVIPPPAGKSNVQMLWKTLDEGTFFLPNIKLRYEQKINGEVVYKEKDIPVKYVARGNELTPIYPFPSNSITVNYDLGAITKTLEEISDGDPAKNNYAIFQKLIFTLTAYDVSASKYISSTSGSVDDLTVSVDVADYTNIVGGFGLFASYSRKTYLRLRFLEDYIRSFGYNYINED